MYQSKIISALSRIIACCLCIITGYLGGCSPEEAVLSDPIPYSIERLGESMFTLEAQSSITKQFSLRVLSKDSKPVPNVSVFFSVDEGLATLSDSTILTNAEGIATVDVTTGSGVQTIRVVAFVPGLLNPSLQFLLEIVPHVPAAIQIVEGDLQETAALTALPQNLQVRVLDAFGNVVPNVTVNFSLTTGNGHIDSNFSQYKTNSKGIAYAKYVTGTLPENIVTASVGNLQSIDFTAYTLIPVQLNSIGSTQNAANLSWTKNINSTFARYSILRAQAKTHNYTEVGSINNPDVTVFADEDADVGRAYTYYVKVITVRGNNVDSNERTGERGELIDLKNESDFADVIINSDKSTIYVALRWSKRVLIISTDSFHKTDSIDLEFSPEALAVSADQKKLYVALYGLPRFQVIDLTTKTLLWDVDISAQIGDDAIVDIYKTANGQLFTSSYGGYVAKIDEANNYSASRVASDRLFSSGAPSFVADRDNYLYMEESLLSPNSLFKIDLSDADAPIVMEDAHGTVNGTRHCALSTDGTLLYLTSGQIVNANTLKPVGEINGPGLSSLQVSDQTLFGCFYGGAFERWKLGRLNLSTQVIEKAIPLGFNSRRMFLSANEDSAFLVSLPIDPYYTVRIYKVNLPN